MLHGLRRWAWLAVCLLAGCATPQLARLQSAPASLAPATRLQVPFVAQTDDTCGPAALAMVLRHYGQPADARQLLSQVQLPVRGGSLQVEMLAATRRNGLLAVRLPGDLKAVLQQVEQGRPVIALVNLAFSWRPRWHYIVITGYDLQREHLYVHSADQASQVWSLSQFERLWARSRHWAYLALPPGQLPVDAQPLAYIQATLDLERTAGLSVAAPAWRVAALSWPDQLPALIGAGNAAYQAGARDEALRWYQAAATQFPQSATAANNLAHVLLESGQVQQARNWAQKAVDLGGGDAARQTLQQAEAAAR